MKVVAKIYKKLETLKRTLKTQRANLEDKNQLRYTSTTYDIGKHN